MTNRISNAYKTAPTHDQLRAMKRDLHFHPSTCEQPTTLSPAQIEAFNRDGFIKDIHILNDAELDVHRSLFEPQLAKALEAGQGSFSLSSAHLKFGKVYDRDRCLCSWSKYSVFYVIHHYRHYEYEEVGG